MVHTITTTSTIITVAREVGGHVELSTFDNDTEGVANAAALFETENGYRTTVVPFNDPPSGYATKTYVQE